jgi:transposase-like protein
MLKVVTATHSECQEITATLDQIAREGAQRLLAEALQREVADYINNHKNKRDENGHALVVRNSKARPRKITVGSGTSEVEAPRVDDRREGRKFSSNILPPYLRKSANVESLLPVLYLKGLSGNAFQEALVNFLGEGVSGLSPASISALKKSWERDFQEWKFKKITERFVYIWADGVNVKIRLGEDKKLCLLVVLGVTEQGEKKLLAVEPGYRESTESWSFVLRDLRQRGLNCPLLAIGDGALGFWAAIRNIFPEATETRCWVHKIANVLDKLPKRLQPKAKELLHQVMYAETQVDAVEARKVFEVAFQAKYPKAVECITKDWTALTRHFNFPAHHWSHIRSTNPIESIFATVKLRTRSTKGAGNAQVAATMAFKLMIEAEKK